MPYIEPFITDKKAALTVQFEKDPEKMLEIVSTILNEPSIPDHFSISAILMKQEQRSLETNKAMLNWVTLLTAFGYGSFVTPDEFLIANA